MKITCCFFLVLSVFVVNAASICSFPLQNWCDSDEIARECGVLEVCRERRQLKNEANPIKLQVHFESYCKDSKRFITTQLYPTWQEIGHLFEVELFPYGKATSTIEANGDFTFNCNHGEEECLGNRIQNCGIQYSNNDVKLFLPFISCMMSVNDTNSVAKQCADEMSLPYPEIDSCSTGEEGHRLLYEAGEKTHALDPSLNWVPWIVLNGVHTDEIQTSATEDLKKFICETYQGEAPECN